MSASPYDPFLRGLHPVGVQSIEITDSARGERRLRVELWYPAVNSVRGLDLSGPGRDRYELMAGFEMTQAAVRDAAVRLGSFPLVVFSHGCSGHRRQSTFLCTHLASHGYVVASADHTGNTFPDVIDAMLAGKDSSSDPGQKLRETVADRPADVSTVIDRLLGGHPEEIARVIDRTKVGLCGHSFGGWTTLATTPRDSRIAVAFPLAPAGSSKNLRGDLPHQALDFDWDRVVPTLFIVAERDSILPLEGMHELFALTRAPKKLVVMENADHMHFCDNAERIHEIFRSLPELPNVPRVSNIPPFSELCPGEHVADTVRGLGVAHMDAHLKGASQAKDFLASDLTEALASRGITARVTTG